jgi:hypothetical protein
VLPAFLLFQTSLSLEKELMLSAWDKQRFFEDLEAFLGPCRTKKADEIEKSKHNILEMPVKRKTTEKSSAVKKKKNNIDLKDQVLENKRVVLVPIGPDVSRKRLEIWQEMVEKHGGQCIEVHMHKNPRRASLEKPFDWTIVDYVIASNFLDLDKLYEYYKIHTFPSNIKVYTSEWLVHLSREKKLPSSDAYILMKKKSVDEAQEKKVEETETHNPDHDNWDEQGEDSDGGTSLQLEIERAPRVTVDSATLELEQQEIKKRNKQLVNERIPIFYKNNPHFKGISSADQTSKLKNESFICQKTSSKCLKNLSHLFFRFDRFSWGDVIVVMQRNLNAHITEILDELMEYLHVEKDIWREYSYKVSNNVLWLHDVKQIPNRLMAPIQTESCF